MHSDNQRSVPRLMCRILALAGYDSKAAVDHFSESVADLHEINNVEDGDESLTGRMFKLWTWATHPTPQQRTEAIRTELDRWMEEAEERGR
jgi:predicted Zn-dependent protease